MRTGKTLSAFLLIDRVMKYTKMGCGAVSKDWPRNYYTDTKATPVC